MTTMIYILAVIGVFALTGLLHYLSLRSEAKRKARKKSGNVKLNQSK